MKSHRRNVPTAVGAPHLVLAGAVVRDDKGDTAGVTQRVVAAVPVLAQVDVVRRAHGENTNAVVFHAADLPDLRGVGVDGDDARAVVKVPVDDEVLVRLLGQNGYTAVALFENPLLTMVLVVTQVVAVVLVNMDGIAS